MNEINELAGTPVTCRGVVARLGDYVDGELDTAGRLRVASHLDRCDACAVYLERYRAAERLLRWAYRPGAP